LYDSDVVEEPGVEVTAATRGQEVEAVEVLENEDEAERRLGGISNRASLISRMDVKERLIPFR
jgi:hypothetical protein